jgi:saccharopine dehydrogenase (NAD+, L-lysine-forming)
MALFPRFDDEIRTRQDEFRRFPMEGGSMRLLILGAGGVGSAAALIAARRPFASAVVLADYDADRAARAAAATGDVRFTSAQVDAGDQAAIEALIDAEHIDAVLGATDPRFTMPIFQAALSRRIHYLDMAMSLSQPHPERPYEQTGVKLGDQQFELQAQWAASGRLALVGIGVEPGLADIFARYASDELFDEIDEAGVRDGSNITVSGYDFAPSFSIWTTIEECLNPPVIYEKDRGWFTTEPFSEPEIFDFPEGIGPVECVNVEHEEVLLIPRWIDVKRATFKYGLGNEFIEVLKTLHLLGLDKTEQVQVGDIQISPRDVVAACLPDPADLGARMSGKTCAGMWVRGTGKDGQPRSTYLYHVVDNEWSMREYGAQAVVWQTAVNPVVALELIATGVWSGSAIVGPEAMEPKPFLDLLAGEYNSPWGIKELEP